MNSVLSISSFSKSFIPIPMDFYASLPAVCKPENTDVLIGFDNSDTPLNISTKSGTSYTLSYFTPPYTLTYSNPSALLNVDNVLYKFGNRSLQLKIDTTRNHYLQINDFIMDPTTGFSCSCWFRYTELDGSGEASILTTDGVTYAGRWGCVGIWFKTASQIRVQVGWKTIDINCNQDFNIATYGISNNGSWNHIGFSVSSTGVILLVVNGTQVSWTSGVCLYTSSQQANVYLAGSGRSYKFRVGDNSYVMRTRFVGNVDQVRLYNATLSVAEIQTLYNNGC